MNLKEFNETKKSKIATRALKETYDMELNFHNLNYPTAKSMLTKVRGLIKETKSSKKYHMSEQNGKYLKLLILEQGLADHVTSLSHAQAIITENEEIKKSQVIMAAQSMADSIQKMLEDTSKMNVEELNAVVDGIKSEYGDDLGSQFNTSVSEALQTLIDSINSTKQALDSAISGISSGQISSAPMGDLDMPAGDMEDQELGSLDSTPSMDQDMEEPESFPTTNIGRARR